MFAPSTVIVAILFYIALLFILAHLVEQRARRTGRSNHPLIYALSFTVYSTSWAFYGSAGLAVSSGWIYAAFDLGAILSLLFAWQVLRKMVLLKNEYRLTSIADLLSTRYSRSQAVAALVSLLLLFGSLPYIALQLKAVVVTFSLLTRGDSSAVDWGLTGLLIVGLMILFTVMFGVRRLDPTERHQGMMAALAAESLIKLVSLSSVGLFVLYGLHSGWSDLFARVPADFERHLFGPEQELPLSLWISTILLGAITIYLLPRQFHVGVVENASVRHLPWLVGITILYQCLINLFVTPLAGAGLILGLPVQQADSFVLLIPMHTQQLGLALFVFIGGFSAATAMVIVSTMTLATMSTNHLLLPVIENSDRWAWLRAHLLQCRWIAVALILLAAYAFAWSIGESRMLVALGSLSLLAVAQLAPATLGGLYWAQGNKAGALLGLGVGLLIWIYTLVLPIYVDQGWLPRSLLEQGPAGISWLRPQALFGLEGLPELSHSVIWSLGFNSVAYVLGSLLLPTRSGDRTLALQFVKIRHHASDIRSSRPTGLREYIEFAPKLIEARGVLRRYLDAQRTEQVLKQIVHDLDVIGKSRLSMMELVEFHWLVERMLAGSIGAAAAHSAMESHIQYSAREASELKIVHDHILAELQVTPAMRANMQEAGDVQTEEALRSRQQEIQKQKEIIETLKERIAKLETNLEHEREKGFKQHLMVQHLQVENEELVLQLQTCRGQLGKTQPGSPNGG